MTTVLLIIHGLMAVALLGAITHQAISVGLPGRRPAGSFVERVRVVTPTAYVGVIVVLYVITAILGAIIYPEYRLQVRIVVEQLGLWLATTGVSAAIAEKTLALYFEPERRVLPRQAEIELRGLTQMIALMGEAGLLQAPLPAAERFVDLQYLQAAGIR